MVPKLIKYFSIIFLSCGDMNTDYHDWKCENRCKTGHFAGDFYEVDKGCMERCLKTSMKSAQRVPPNLKSIEYKPDVARESQLGPATIIAENSVTNNCRN